MKDRKVYIYFAEYSNLEEIYIGSTFDIIARRHAHANLGTSLADRDLAKKRKVRLTVLHITNNQNRLFYEKYFIELISSFGIKLKNKNKIRSIKSKSFEKSKCFSYNIIEKVKHQHPSGRPPKLVFF